MKDAAKDRLVAKPRQRVQSSQGLDSRTQHGMQIFAFHGD
jgi:hypothetical protein